MPRLIDADKFITDNKPMLSSLLMRRINDAPTVDAVEVVRCKDCKHYKEFEGEMECWARPMMFPRDPDDYCSMGERKNGQRVDKSIDKDTENRDTI